MPSFFLLHGADVIEIKMRVHRRVTNRVAVNCKVLHGRAVERAAVLAFELRERQRHELRMRRLREVRQIDFEILAIRVQLADELLAAAVGLQPELHGIIR